MASVVLDHAGLGTVEKHYNQAGTHAAFRRVHHNLETLRHRLKPAYERFRIQEEKAD